MSSVVLDTSAAIAVIDQEPGAALVDASVQEGAVLGAVNLSELVAKLADHGLSQSAIEDIIDQLNVDIVPFDKAAAYDTGMLRPLTRHLGLGLGDRACLALGRQLNLPVLTADRIWQQLQIGVTVQAIR